MRYTVEAAATLEVTLFTQMSHGVVVATPDMAGLAEKLDKVKDGAAGGTYGGDNDDDDAGGGKANADGGGADINAGGGGDSRGSPDLVQLECLMSSTRCTFVEIRFIITLYVL
ncbi:unnamed protein product [Cuscuta europaea]|uniref:Uncharacterized protein n=1 Tax=Cuscuta europaea TaxID=41803 RepID=A0A9P1E617_CUSEU|nr:unnamed protein product [Cuscuta europaea]CAH9081080.1 unnamed protein product [Cuscuta europaea]CAH9081081.1 unnamed protein product [Cuscuta europaea]